MSKKYIADSFAKIGGTSVQFLKADGSVDSSILASEGYVDSAITALVDSSPATLDTLNELAAALGDDPNFATTVATSIGEKLPLAGGTMTGTITSIGTNNTSKISFLDVKRGSGAGLYLKFQTDSTAANNVSQFVIRRSTDNEDILSIAATSGNTTLIGTVTIPSYIYHTGDSNTFFGFNSSDQWKVTAGGNVGIQLQNTGVYLYYGGNEKIRTTSAGVSVAGVGTFAGTVTGSNLSGTNTGDQDLSGYLLNTTDTLTGALTVTNNISAQNDLIVSGNIYSTGAITTSSNNSLTISANGTGVVNILKDTNITGNVTGSNLSGTNTGDQDLSGYLLNTTDTLTGVLTIEGNEVISNGSLQIANSVSNVSFYLKTDSTLPSINTKHLEISGSSGSSDIAFSPSTTSAGLLFLDGSTSRVGIGTTSPNQKLHVKGGDIQTQDTTGSNGVLRIRATITGTPSIGGYPNVGAGDAVIEGGGTTQRQAGVITLMNGDSSISSGQDLGVIQFVGKDDQANGYCTSQIISTTSGSAGSGASGGGILRFLTSPGNTGATPQEAMRITNTGNVGIGVTTTSYKLEVGGLSKISGNVIIGTDPSTYANLTLKDATTTGSSSKSLFIISQNSGRSFLSLITAGTGEAQIGFGTSQYASQNTAGSIQYTTATNKFTFKTNYTLALTIANNQAATFTSTVTATNFILSSDKKLKNNIKEIDTSHIDVNWKNFELKSAPGVKRAGVIAQELEEVHPEFVRTDDEGMKSVAYIDLLIAKIAELEARLDKAGI